MIWKSSSPDLSECFLFVGIDTNEPPASHMGGDSTGWITLWASLRTSNCFLSDYTIKLQHFEELRLGQLQDNWHRIKEYFFTISTVAKLQSV